MEDFLFTWSSPAWAAIVTDSACLTMHAIMFMQMCNYHCKLKTMSGVLNIISFVHCKVLLSELTPVKQETSSSGNLNTMHPWSYSVKILIGFLKVPIIQICHYVGCFPPFSLQEFRVVTSVQRKTLFAIVYHCMVSLWGVSAIAGYISNYNNYFQIDHLITIHV